jgi:EpsD family peptidyl-prolyl cis-trans isomerase
MHPTLTRLPAVLLICAAALLQPSAHAQQQSPAAGAQPATDKPIATVNGVPIPQSLLDQALKQALAQGNSDSPQLREAVKSQLIARELFLQEAAKQKLDKDPKVVAAVEEAKRNAMVQRYLQTQVQLKQVTEEDVKAQYEKVKAGVGAKEYQLRAIMLNSEPRAKEVREQAVKGKDFAELARQWSLAPSATRGGELGWVSFKSPAKEGETQGLPLPLAQAVEKLQKGKISEPVAMQNTWWIVKLEDTRPTKVPTFEEAKPQIYRMLQAQEAQRATNELVSKLSKTATITQ